MIWTPPPRMRGSLRGPGPAWLGLLCLLGACRQEGFRCPDGEGLNAVGYDSATLAESHVVLTFDGGPGPATADIGEALAAGGLAATFFVDGARLRTGRAVLGRLVEAGHLIGQRGWTGEPLAQSGDVVTSVARTDREIAGHISGGIYLLRAPEGALTGRLVDRLNAAGLGRLVGSVLWDFGPGRHLSATVCQERGLGPSACAAELVDAVAAAGRGVIALPGDSDYVAALVRDLPERFAAKALTGVRVDGIGAVGRALADLGAASGARGGGGSCASP